MNCIRCDAEFVSFPQRGYCDVCVAVFTERREMIHEKQNPAPGVHACGKFTNQTGPQSWHDPDRGVNVCGLCGSPELEMGYGFAGGMGLGGYTFCSECYAVLDFSEDLGD